MKILLVDQEGLGLDLAIRCAAYGHEIKWLRVCKGASNTDPTYGDGFGFSFVDDLKTGLRWIGKDGFVWMSGNAKYLNEIGRWREFGIKIFGPTAASALWETDREVGMKVLEQAGIDLLPYKTFDTMKAALTFAKKTDVCHVFKPMGDEEDKSLTFVANDPEQLVGWLERKIKGGKKMRGKCMLQEKIDVSCGDYGVSGWIGPDGFLPDKWQICVEHKKLMNGEVGPNTGEMGTVAQYVREDQLSTDMLMPLEKELVKIGHTGDFSVGVVVDTKGKAWPLEFTARAGWPIHYIQTASHIGDPAIWMMGLLNGEDKLKVSREVAIGVVLAQPKWPYGISKPEDVEGNPIAGVEDAGDDIHLAYVRKNGDVYETTYEYVAIATGLGNTVVEAREAVYDVVDKIDFPDKMYRTDIGLKMEESLPKLHDFGYAMPLEFE